MIPIALPQLRWLYWLLIGLAVGALLGGIRVLIGPAYLDSTARTLSQPQFERAITATPAASFSVSDLVLHPPDATGAYWVTGRYRQGGQRDITADFKFRASTPYQPSVAIDSTDLSRLTIAQYLDELTRHIPQANSRYHYAWYEAPGAAMLLWMCGATLLIGGAWPIAFRRFSGNSSAAEPLPKTSCEPEIPQGRLPLDVAPPEPVQAPPPQVEKHYGGEFYPTQVHAKQ
jgi:hypothetical protein